VRHPIISRLPADSSAGTFRALLPLVLALTMGGCAQMPTGAGGDLSPDGTPDKPTAPPIPANAEPPPPAVNLSGFPLPYRQGYADGCASATGPERKDKPRFGADGNYRTGWQDGVALCRKK
jgi:hypothetical protein